MSLLFLFAGGSPTGAATIAVTGVSALASVGSVSATGTGQLAPFVFGGPRRRAPIIIDRYRRDVDVAVVGVEAHAAVGQVVAKGDAIDAAWLDLQRNKQPVDEDEEALIVGLGLLGFFD